jgi:chemotaxis protein CheC
MDVSDYQLDALKESLNIGVGRAASSLNKMINTHIELEVPQISVVSMSELGEENELAKTMASVTMHFEGNVAGLATTVFSKESSKKLVEILVPDAPTISEDLNSISQATLTEVGNVIINAIMGSVSNLCKFELDYKVPTYSETAVKNILFSNEGVSDQVILFGETLFLVEEEEVQGKIFLAFMVEDLKTLFKTLEGA